MSFTAPRSSAVAGRMSTLALTTISVYFDRMIRSLSSAHNGVMDRILLEGMSFHGRHGVRAAEREQPQEFKVNVEVDCDLSEPGHTDRIEDTIDYRRIRAIAKEVIERESPAVSSSCRGWRKSRSESPSGLKACCRSIRPRFALQGRAYDNRVLRLFRGHLRRHDAGRADRLRRRPSAA